MLDFWRNLIDAGLFAAEVQGVIALRLIRLASGGSEASAEMSRMVTEKFTALSAGHAAATSAFLSGNNPVQIMSSALLPIKRRVRKNRHRLAGLRAENLQLLNPRAIDERFNFARTPLGFVVPLFGVAYVNWLFRISCG